MTLKTSSSISDQWLKSYRIRVTQYPVGTLQIGQEPTGGTIVSADLKSVTWTADQTPGTADYSLVYEDSTEIIENNIQGENVSVQQPTIGMEVTIQATKPGEVDANDLSYIFRGYIVDVSVSNTPAGIEYNVKCNDMKGRLKDNYITETFNERQDNISEINFDADNRVLENKKYSIEDILKSIMRKSPIMDSIGVSTYFSYDDIKWDIVADIKIKDQIKDFKPPQISFNATPLGNAIMQTIKTFGNYMLVYDPQEDQLVVTKTSINADQCGDQFNVTFATTDKTDQNKEYTWEVNGIEDRTNVSMTEMANIVRIGGAPIRWYTGHYFVDPSGLPASGVAQFETTPDASGKIYMPGTNWEGHPYSINKGERSTIEENGNKYFIVGIPAYPAWDIRKGYKPYKAAVERVVKNKQNDKVGDEKYESYKTTPDWEYELVTENESNMIDRDASTKDFGTTFEMWYPWFGPCKGCNGSGAVEDTAEARLWDDNPDWFGNSRNADGTPKSYTSDLEPFDYGTRKDVKYPPINSNNTVTKNDNREVISVPTNIPLPWKNMCPACRGTGMEPHFRIRKPQQKMVDSDATLVKVQDAVLNSPQQMTWDEYVNRVIYSYNITVQAEKKGTRYLVKEKDDKPGESEPRGSKILHPLWGTKFRNSIGLDPSEEESQFLPANKKYHDAKGIWETTIDCHTTDYNIDTDRGLIIFNEPQVIGCERAIRMFNISDDGGLILNPIDKDKTKWIPQELEPAKDNLKTYTNRDRKRDAWWRQARIWFTCYFVRDKYNHSFDTPGAGETENPRTFTVDGIDYRVQSAIINNKPFYEIYKKYSESYELDPSNRPIVKEFSSSQRWDVSVEDYDKIPVPTASGYDQYTSEAGYIFPQGMLHVHEQLNLQEVGGDSAGWQSEDIGTLTSKKIAWDHLDERFDLIEKGVEYLESSNNVSINGSVVVRGANYDGVSCPSISNGFGWVTLPRVPDTKSCIKKVTHKFGGSYTLELELTTEEFRLGEDDEEERNRKRAIDAKLNEIDDELRAIKKDRSANRPLGRYGEKRRVSFGSLSGFIHRRGKGDE